MTTKKAKQTQKVKKTDKVKSVKQIKVTEGIPESPEVTNDLEVEENQPLQILEAVKKPKISVCIPYFAEKAQGIELLMALRSIEKNFKEDFQIVIIGDKPAWLSNEAIFIDAPNISRNAGVDTLHKIMMAIVDERVSDHFIMTYDDIYFNSPVILPDIQILVANGTLSRPDDSTTFFHKNKSRTIDALDSRMLKKFNYDTHTPYYFEKEKLAELLEVFEEFNSETESLLLSSIYFNYHYPDFTPLMIDNVKGNYLLRLINQNPDPNAFQKYIVGKKFVNNSINGYTKMLVDYLNKNFPEKSRFEV